MPEFQNVETGEMHLVGILKRPKHSGRFVLLFQAQLLELLRTNARELSAVELRVLLFLIASCDYDNRVDDHYIGDIAAFIKHERSAVSKALTTLERCGLLTRERGEGRRPGKMLVDPELIFRGTVRQREKVLRDWPWRRFVSAECLEALG